MESFKMLLINLYLIENDFLYFIYLGCLWFYKGGFILKQIIKDNYYELDLYKYLIFLINQQKLMILIQSIALFNILKHIISI